MKKVLLFGFILSLTLSLTVSAQTTVDYLIIKQYFPDGQQDTVMMNMSKQPVINQNDTTKLTMQKHDTLNLADYGNSKQLMLRAYDSARISNETRMMAQKQLSSKIRYFFNPWPSQQETTKTKQLWAKGEGQTIAFWERIKLLPLPVQTPWKAIVSWFLLLIGIVVVFIVGRDKKDIKTKDENNKNIVFSAKTMDFLAASVVLIVAIIIIDILDWNNGIAWINLIIIFIAIAAANNGYAKESKKLTTISIVASIILWIIIFYNN